MTILSGADQGLNTLNFNERGQRTDVLWCDSVGNEKTLHFDSPLLEVICLCAASVLTVRLVVRQGLGEVHWRDFGVGAIWWELLRETF